jgi:hypothetical protein
MMAVFLYGDKYSEAHLVFGAIVHGFGAIIVNFVQLHTVLAQLL